VKYLREAGEQYKLVAIADEMTERHETAAELGIKAFRNYRDLLADRSLGIELVVNALPSHLHVAGTIEALNAGYHVLCEKPIATKVADFDAMVAAATKAGKHFFCFQNSRFQPVFVKMQELLASGKLGKLVNARICFSNYARRWDWQASQDYQGGNINNTGPHPLDQAVVLFGDRTPQVFSKLVSANPFGDADNFATVILHGPDAPTIEVTVSSLTPYPQGEMYNLSCTHGGISGDLSQLKWKYFKPETAPEHTALPRVWSDKRSFNRESLEWIEETFSAPTKDFMVDLSRGLYDNVFAVIREGAEPVIKLSEVRRQVAVLEEVHRQNPLAKR
jgi:predicted dehydrogenase